MGAVRSGACERAHAWVSLALDGELSEVEQALLRTHVGRCAACAAYERDLAGLTQELRRAPLARPAADLLVRRRSAPTQTLRRASAAAAVAFAAGLGSAAGSLDARASSAGGPPPSRPRDAGRRDAPSVLA